MKPLHRTVLLILFSFSLLAFMAPFVRELIGYALDFEHTNASQIVLIPFISAALIWLERKKIFACVASAPLAGSAVVALGFGLYWAGRDFGPSLADGDRLALMSSSLIVIWLGGFLLFYGLRAFRAALFPLLFLIFCLPVPSPIMNRAIPFLQHCSADVSFLLLRLTGTPVYQQGTILTLPDLVIEVAPQCSGIRSAISLFILSCLAGHLLLRSLWRWGTLLVATIPILIFKNALRIGTLTLLALHVDKRILESRLHQEGGIPFFAVGLLLIYPILLFLIKSESKSAEIPAVVRET